MHSKWQILSILMPGLLILSSGPVPTTPPRWIEWPVGGEPSWVYGSSLAYDSHRGVLVRFGGGNTWSIALDETWELDLRSHAWAKRTPAHSPPGRGGARLTYDAARRVTVLFGGETEDGSLHNDTWLWDGVDWTEVFPAHQPVSRYFHGQTYDSRRREVVVFGGYSREQPTYRDDLWQWDGTDWQQRAANPTPTGRLEMAFAYDSRRDVLVLFGGVDSSNWYNDTWEWAAGVWTQHQPPASPPARAYVAAGYSPGAGYTMVFGGYGSDFGVHDDTYLWDGERWRQVAQDHHPNSRPGALCRPSPQSGHLWRSRSRPRR